MHASELVQAVIIDHLAKSSKVSKLIGSIAVERPDTTPVCVGRRNHVKYSIEAAYRKQERQRGEEGGLYIFF